MISQWQLLAPDISPYVVIVFVVGLAWILVSFWRRDSKSLQHPPEADACSDRWLCRTLFNIRSERFQIGMGELVSAVCPVKKDWVFVKNCRTEELGWLPQSCLELVQDSGPKMEKARLKVMFKDHHLPVDSPAKPIADGIIWCVFVFSPESDLNDLPDLGHLKSHVAVVVLSKNYRRVRVGGADKIDVQDSIPHQLNEHDFVECFSYIHTRLHPQRLIVIINSSECPLPALSGRWSGEECPNWIPMEPTARLLERIHLRTPIALLILNSPRKANLFALHVFHQCCSVLVAAQETAASNVLHSNVLQMLLSRPDVSMENLISMFILSSEMVAFNCNSYPNAAVVIKAVLNVVLSMFNFLSDREKTDFYNKIQALRNCSKGVLVDEYVDILAFCSAARAIVPDLHILRELQRRLSACVRQMVIPPKKSFSSGLWMHMPSGLTVAGHNAVFSQIDTYLPYLSHCYAYYDIVPRLQKNIIAMATSSQNKRQDYSDIQHSA